MASVFDQTYQSRYLECGIAPRVLEPGVLVRGVIHHEIDEHADAALLGPVRELDEIAERAVAGIDVVIIGDVIAVVALGRGLERHQPEGRDAEAVQVIQAAHQPLEVADAVAIGIHVGADRQAVDHRVLVPEIVDHGCPRFPGLVKKLLWLRLENNLQLLVLIEPRRGSKESEQM